MAEIIKREGKHGITFKIIVSYGRDINGKKLRAVTSFKSEKKSESAQLKEAKLYALEYEKAVKEGRLYDISKITFADFYAKWEEQWAKHHLTELQLEQYKSYIDRRILPAIGKKELSKVTPIDCQDIINSMVQEGKKASTIRRYVTALNSVMSYAFKMDLVRENPVLRCELPKQEKNTDIHYFNETQARYFLSELEYDFPKVYKAHDCETKGGAYHVAEYVERHPIPTQFKVYFNLAIFGGFRRGELIALNWSDISFSDHTIDISKSLTDTRAGVFFKEPKTKAGNRCIVLPGSCFDLLQTWKAEEEQLRLSLGDKWQGAANMEDQAVFIQKTGKRMSIYTPAQRFESLVHDINEHTAEKIAAVKEDKNLSPAERKAEIEKLNAVMLPKISLHDLRHTSASILIGKGIDAATVSRRLGHSKTSTTLNIYTHPLPSQDEKAVQLLDKLLG